MSASALSVLPELRLRIRPVDSIVTDAELLTRFIERQDHDAFEALLKTHGPMVLGVCRRILRNDSDAEDAFQATFVVLMRKAAAIVPRQMVGNWLYGVAYLTATKARAMNAKRSAKERRMTGIQAATTPYAMEQLQELLDQELQKLPAIYRSALVLCELEGVSIKQAAKQLGCPAGTLGVRLTRGRSLLAQRITRRKSLLAGGLLAACLSNAASASVPASLLSLTSKSIVQGSISSKVTALAGSVMQAMLLTKLKLAACSLVAVVLSLTVVAAGSTAFETSNNASVTWQASDDSKLPQPAPKKPVKAANFIWAVAFTHDGKSLVVSEGEKLVRLWDMKTQLPGKTLLDASGRIMRTIRSVAVSPNGKLLAAGGDDGIMFVWDLAPNKLLFVVGPAPGMILTVAFSPDGRFIATASHFVGKLTSSTVQLYDATSGKLQKTIRMTEDIIPNGSSAALAFRPDSKELAVLSYGKFTGIRLYDVANARETSRIEYETGFIPQSVAYTPDGLKLATGGIAPALPNPNDARFFGMPRGHVKIWDAKTGNLQETLFDDSDGDVKALAFSKTTNRLYVGTTTRMGEPFQTKDGLVGRLGGSYQCWDITNWKKQWEAQTRGGMTFGLSLSTDDKQLAIANSAGCWVSEGGLQEGKFLQIAQTPETPPAK